MDFQTLPLVELNPAAYNPRNDLQPGDPEYEALKRSIDTFGLVEPIVWNQQTGNIVGGHQRYKILLSGGVEETDCVVVDLDETQEKALNLALNKISGDWDEAALSAVLRELEQNMADITLTGFELDEVERLLMIEADRFGEEFSLPEGEKESFEQMSFTLATEQADAVKAALKEAGKLPGEIDNFGNENSNGNALYRVVIEWQAQRTSS